MIHSLRFCTGLSLLLLTVTRVSRANVALPAIFSEHAVLQRATNVPVWGKADANERVTVTLDKAPGPPGPASRGGDVDGPDAQRAKDGLGIPPGKSAFSRGDKLPLAGEWLAKVEYELPPPDAGARASLPAPPRAQPGGVMLPSLLFNGMIRPLIPYAVAGIVWYQGESNVKRAYEYRRAFPTLIRDWRSRWGRGDLPFYFCQLANYTDEPLAPGARHPSADSTWAELRESQSLALSLPNTGQAVLIDLGEEKNIHPVNKADVGGRLALIALNKVYGKPVVCSGPVYDGMKVEEGRMRIAFKHADGGLVARPLPTSYQPTSLSPDTVPLVRNSPHSQIKGFAVCGEDGKWQWADARISGNDVVVESAGVSHPVAARYAWADSPICNLYNGAGLPAGPFRTDHFPSSTERNRY